MLTGGLAGRHFQVNGEDSRTRRCRPGAAPPASRRSTCHQQPDCNTPVPIRPNPLLTKGRLYFLFASIIAALAFCNAVYHLAATGFIRVSLDGDRIGLYLLMHVLLLLITVIAGRIVPNFTNNWLHARGQARAAEVRPAVDRAAIMLTAAVGLFMAFLPVHPLTGGLAFAAALVHAVRLARWQGLATREEPLLFVLHAAYAWLPAGYLLLGCAVFGWLVPVGVALHALTIGGIALMILGVMTRVALAHTGRKLHVGGAMVAAYWLLGFAVLLRLLSPSFSSYYMLVNASGAAWVAAFVLFAVVYWPILTGPAVSAGR